MPLLAQMRGGWDSKQAAAETLQNGRILIDHLHRNLAKAVKITAVSDSSETNGYIEFEDNDGNDVRYDVNSTSDYVEFGHVGDLSDLAGPVNQLQFTCYDACDLDRPTTDVNSIRFVEVQTVLTNLAAMGQDKTLTAAAYLRANGSTSSSGTAGPAPTYHEFTEAKTSSNVTSITISTPGGTNEGDLLVAAVATNRRTSSSLAAPDGEGWTEIDVGEGGNNVTLGT